MATPNVGTLNSISRNQIYKGLYSSNQTVTFSARQSGYLYVYSQRDRKWYRKTTSKATSGSITIDKNASETSLAVGYSCALVTNDIGSPYSGGINPYLIVHIPTYAFKGYVNSSTPSEINSSDYSTPTPRTAPSGYTFYGWTSSSSAVTVGCPAGTPWSDTYGGKWLDGKTWYAVFKKPGSTTSVTLNIRGSTATATKKTTDAYIGGVGTTKSGGDTSYTGNGNPSSISSTYGNYVFQGWSKSSTSWTSLPYSTPREALDDDYTGTIYAVFKRPAYTNSITLNANGGTISSTTASRTISESYLYGSNSMSGGNPSYTNGNATPSRPGYKFQGWALSSTASAISYSSASQALDSGVSGPLYAVWDEETYTAYFNANGGSGSVSSRPATYNSAFTFPSGSSLYLDGYEFQGWSTRSTGSGIIYGAGERWVWQWTDDMVFYAVWEESTKGVRIFESSTSSSLYAVYISNGSSWALYAPYVYDGGWKEIG